ncbi:MAG: hypothetical protein IJ246_05260 [Clostridia bacterium]|nr:hypothetical protein [Clostridia bacterium]
MADPKKVIRGLECCTAFNGFHQCQPKAGNDCPYEDEDDCELTLMEDALQLLKEQFAKDNAVPDKIVRCKDCKHYRKDTGYCERDIMHGYAGTWFCADGERRTEPEPEPKPCVYCGGKAVRKQLHFKPEPGEDVYKCEHHEDGSLKWSYLECEKCGRSTGAYCYESQSTRAWNNGEVKAMDKWKWRIKSLTT